MVVGTFVGQAARFSSDLGIEDCALGSMGCLEVHGNVDLLLIPPTPPPPPAYWGGGGQAGRSDLSLFGEGSLLQADSLLLRGWFQGSRLQFKARAIASEKTIRYGTPPPPPPKKKKKWALGRDFLLSRGR